MKNIHIRVEKPLNLVPRSCQINMLTYIIKHSFSTCKSTSVFNQSNKKEGRAYVYFSDSDIAATVRHHLVLRKENKGFPNHVLSLVS